MKYPCYARYRDSGVDWLGVVPAHWDVKRLKYVTELIVEKADDMPQGGRYVALEHIDSWTGRRIDGDVEQRPESQTNRFRSGDVLFGKLRPYLAKVWSADFDGYTSGELLVLRQREWLPEFAKYFCLSRNFISLVNSSTYGSKMPRANWEFIGNQLVLIPPEDEQRAIAAFLDHETARIDALIATKRRFLARLKEKRAALISRAVTRGFDPDVPLKDSGTDWLPKLPSHWEMKRLRYLFHMSGGMTPEKAEPRYWDGDIPWVTPKDMKVDVISDSEDHITAEAVQETGLSTIPPKAVLLVVRGMILAHSIPVALTIAPMTVNQDMKALIATDEVQPEYLAWMLRGLKGLLLTLVEESGHGTKALRTDVLRSLKVPLPPRSEQERIAAELAKFMWRKRELRASTRSAIKVLTEQRAALISAAVTGRRAVA